MATEPAAHAGHEHEHPSSGGLTDRPRQGAVVALCGAVLLAGQVAEATGRLDEGGLGALLARSDVAGVVVLVLGVAVVVTPSVLRLLDGRPPVDWRRHVVRWLLPLYAVWLPIVVLDLVMVDPARSWRSLLSTLVLFRPVRGAPLTGLALGPVLTMLAMTVVLVPLAARLLRPRTSPRILLVGAAALAVVGLLVRTALVAGGATGPFGALSWLPAHLDAVAAGVAVAVLGVAGWSTGKVAVWALGAGVAALALAAIVLPRSALLVGAADVWVRDLLYVIAAAGVVLAVGTVTRPSGRLAHGLAAAAPGLLLAHSMAFHTIARQYADAVAETPLGLRLTGPALPVWLWSATIAAAIGVVLTGLVVAPMQRVLTGRWPLGMAPLALATVVAGGLLIRVATWLTIAPVKTDGGDPFFYHVTANALAAGRGFPEPLSWLDSETHVASALHGPLYPVVLSVSSRLGGTTYVDHKFVSILIGTATVLLTALVARRLAGDTAAVVAGGLAAVYPNLWLIDSLLFPEGLFAMLTTACVLLAYQWRDRPTWTRAAGLGVLIGLAGLTRGEGLLLGVLLAAPWILGHRDIPWASRWRQLLLAGAACVAVLVPWTVRNVTTFEPFVPLSTNSNELIMYANCEDTYSGRLLGFWSFACQERHRAEFGEPPGDEAEKAVYWRDVGWRYAREHLDELPEVVAVRVLRQWELFRPWQMIEFSTIESRDREWAAAGLVVYYALAVMAIAGGVVLRRRRVPLLPLVAQAVSVTLTAAYAYGTVRFRAPMEPVLCVLAGVWLAAVVARLSRSSPIAVAPS